MISSYFQKRHKIDTEKSKPQMIHDETRTIQLSKNSYVITGKVPEECVPDFAEMMSLRPHVPDTVIMMGKPVLTPRFVAHYLKPYYYTGRTHEAKPLPEVFTPLLKWANEYLLPKWAEEHSLPKGDVKFNQVLVNYYMNGLHYIGKHSDDEKQLLQGYPIFSASFGESRTFRIRTKTDDSIVHDHIMENGSFLLMCGDMQKEFKHEVPKMLGKKAENCLPRINVTFRVFK